LKNINILILKKIEDKKEYKKKKKKKVNVCGTSMFISSYIQPILSSSCNGSSPLVAAAGGAGWGAGIPIPPRRSPNALLVAGAEFKGQHAHI
jgi:hypothetical protein